ncbi:homeodomain-interacting protein kinase 2-like [Trachinotus anak]|uniref:homeodomain-interacting protein kinase 2-like n=1 Tax=Trachinotus anak TaxID=443729 RepID=UPI0039F24550
MDPIYRDQDQFPSSEESSSSSSGDESQAILGVLSSPSSDYLVQSFVGEGVFGKVAKCLKTATKETVAVKVIKDTNFTAAAQCELDILQELRAFDSDRFNFVRYNDTFFDGQNLCLEFEMLDKSLSDFLEEKPSNLLSVKEIRPILHQMGIALQLLSSLRIVHADLKLDNVMLVDHVNQPLKIKLIDFGWARYVSQTTTGSYLQPRYYRSPEVILGLPFTEAIDMWSLGCVAAELYLGHVLYPGSCEYDMLRHIVQTQGQLPQQLLNDGVKTWWFFQRNRCRGRRWRLKTPIEYGQTTWTESYFNSLDDLENIRPPCHLADEDTTAETTDRKNFVNLLKKMLHLDLNERITPSQLIEDPFISMSDLAESYPYSFYVKSCCEVMEVCRDQSPSTSRNSEVQSVQQPWLSPQASTSTASLDQHNVSHQVVPAWHSHQEHPLILGITSAITSYLSIHEEQSLQQPLQPSFSTHNERTSPELQLPIACEFAPSCTGNIKPVRKMKRDAFEVPQSSERSPESVLPENKRMKRNTDFPETHTELCQNPKEYSSKGASRTAKAQPQRKRTMVTFIKRKRIRRRMSLHQVSRQASSEGPSNTAAFKPTRKRMWATFVAAHSGDRSPDSALPERKRRKMNPGCVQTCKDLLQNEAPTEASSSTDKSKPHRKRTWATFIASYIGIRRQDTSSPERKKKMSLDEVETQTELLQNSTTSMANAKPQRKRTWATFIASYTGIRRQDTGSPERKNKKMSLDEVEKQTETLCSSKQASSSRASESEISTKTQGCSSPNMKTRKKGKRKRRKSMDGLRTRRGSNEEESNATDQEDIRW